MVVDGGGVLKAEKKALAFEKKKLCLQKCVFKKKKICFLALSQALVTSKLKSIREKY